MRDHSDYEKIPKKMYAIKCLIVYYKFYGNRKISKDKVLSTRNKQNQKKKNLKNSKNQKKSFTSNFHK